mmetsp:Transcript_18080/g.37283  ORF Transcript_18080/g.37283 Transcript_18080/m.37283 type:complete len:80 (-) Transcript_18080:456-695(-)
MASKFVKQVEQIVTGSPLVIFSKTTCGYCARAKSLLDSMKVTFNAVELNQIGTRVLSLCVSLCLSLSLSVYVRLCVSAR